MGFFLTKKHHWGQLLYVFSTPQRDLGHVRGVTQHQMNSDPNTLGPLPAAEKSIIFVAENPFNAGEARFILLVKQHPKMSVNWEVVP